VIKADTLRTQIDKEFDDQNPLSVFAVASKIVSTETIKAMAERLAKAHKPIKIDYRKRFGIEDKSPKREQSQQGETKIATSASPANSPKTKTCPQCGALMAVRVAKKGAHANEPFWGCTKYPRCKAIVSYEKD
jgi:hypothetical protein